MFKNKMLGVLGASAMAVVLLASCGDGKTHIKVWSPIEDQATLKTRAEAFQQAHPEVAFDWEVCNEGDVKSKYTLDPDAAADVFTCADDNLTELIKINAVKELTGDTKTAVAARDEEWAVKAASNGEKLYGFPQSGDNGYFLWYNKSILSENDIKTVEGIVAKGKLVFPGINGDKSGNGWYVPGILGASDNDRSQLSVTTKADGSSQQVCGWANATNAAYCEAVKLWYNNTGKTNLVLTETDTMDTEFCDGKIAAVISGTWKAETYSAKLGNNLGAAKLPTLIAKQMSGFKSAKITCVKSTSKVSELATQFADFITNKDGQKLRFDNRHVIPSNKEALAIDAVKNDKITGAITGQFKYCYSQAKAVCGNFWTPAGNIYVGMFNGKTTWTDEATSTSALVYLQAQVAEMTK